MLPSGGLSSLVICTRGGTVLHERQFAGGAEGDTAATLRLRQALFSLAQPLLPVARQEEEHVALLDDLVVVWLTVSDLLVFVAGAGVVVDELSLSVICRAVVAALRSATGKAGVSCSALLDPHTFAKALVTLDELLPGGVLETTDEETVHSGAKMKLPISK